LFPGFAPSLCGVLCMFDRTLAAYFSFHIYVI